MAGGARDVCRQAGALAALFIGRFQGMRASHRRLSIWR